MRKPTLTLDGRFRGCCPQPCACPSPKSAVGHPYKPFSFASSIGLPQPHGTLELDEIFYDPMLRYVLLKAPVPASTGSSARPSPEASPHSPAPPLTAREANSCRPTSNLFPRGVVPQPQPLSGVGEIKEKPAGEVRSEFGMIILCIHTILTPSGPAAPPGRDWSERGEASPKLRSTLDAPSPVVLRPSPCTCANPRPG